jgi:hypothetical protein
MLTVNCPVAADNPDVVGESATMLAMVTARIGEWMLGVSRSLLGPGWDWPIHGLRHPPAGGMSGWYVWTGELSGSDDFFLPLHASHLIHRVPDVEAHLSLPPGSRFLIASNYTDVWNDDTLLDVSDS